MVLEYVDYDLAGLMANRDVVSICLALSLSLKLVASILLM